MTSRATSIAIEEAAACWAVRTDAGALEDAAAGELDAWLAADPRHLGAYARAMAVLAAADRAPALRSGLERLVEEQAELAGERPAAFSRRRTMGWMAVAVGVAAVGLPIAQLRGRRMETGRGEVQLVALDDGSRITLDTASRVETRFDARLRLVVLEAGEALFDVARDPGRPFLVRAGNTEVRAIGTSFSVSLQPGGNVTLVVREGLVDVRRLGSAGTVPATANSVTMISPAAPVPTPTRVQADEISRRLAWREGMLAFENERLDSAIAQFARYSDVSISITDEALAARRVSGWFSASDPKGFARAAALSLGVQAEETPEGVRLSS